MKAEQKEPTAEDVRKSLPICYCINSCVIMIGVAVLGLCIMSLTTFEPLDPTDFIHLGAVCDVVNVSVSSYDVTIETSCLGSYDFQESNGDSSTCWLYACLDTYEIYYDVPLHGVTYAEGDSYIREETSCDFSLMEPADSEFEVGDLIECWQAVDSSSLNTNWDCLNPDCYKIIDPVDEAENFNSEGIANSTAGIIIGAVMAALGVFSCFCFYRTCQRRIARMEASELEARGNEQPDFEQVETPDSTENVEDPPSSCCGPAGDWETEAKKLQGKREKCSLYKDCLFALTDKMGVPIRDYTMYGAAEDRRADWYAGRLVWQDSVLKDYAMVAFQDHEIMSMAMHDPVHPVSLSMRSLILGFMYSLACIFGYFSFAALNANSCAACTCDLASLYSISYSTSTEGGQLWMSFMEGCPVNTTLCHDNLLLLNTSVDSLSIDELVDYAIVQCGETQSTFDLVLGLVLAGINTGAVIVFKMVTLCTCWIENEPNRNKIQSYCLQPVAILFTVFGFLLTMILSWGLPSGFVNQYTTQLGQSLYLSFFTALFTGVVSFSITWYLQRRSESDMEKFKCPRQGGGEGGLVAHHDIVPHEEALELDDDEVQQAVGLTSIADDQDSTVEMAPLDSPSANVPITETKTPENISANLVIEAEVPDASTVEAKISEI